MIKIATFFHVDGMDGLFEAESPEEALHKAKTDAGRLLYWVKSGDILAQYISEYRASRCARLLAQKNPPRVYVSAQVEYLVE